ncbi:YiiX/YebB-like N1pC/P60 family cysteine hydrolase [Leptolyngbya sp. AN02str]|uniref:YiiX/YebB-like N1pC/P60 family cysteine hydrolase n=1 Tax=Leptolyngbya sp. AN02str TaxID=3423363 RepID=UPI003D313C67
MIYSHQFNGLTVTTGDIICTVDGTPNGLYGKFWQHVGGLIPGAIDHCALYVGPAGRCVEANPMGVVVYDMPGDRWDASLVTEHRLFVDTLYGIAYPLANRGLSLTQERRIRVGVAQYCLLQASIGKPYNFNFPNSSTENAFYCSQLIYSAYLKYGINLNTNRIDLPSLDILEAIVFPEEIWNECPHSRPAESYITDRE